MAVAISRGVHDALLAAAAATPDIEVCGILFGNDNRIDAFETAINRAANPADRFEIDPAALVSAHRRARNGGDSIAGYFHSHPNGLCEPSSADSEMMSSDGSIWAIVAAESVTLWRATADGFKSERIAIVD